MAPREICSLERLLPPAPALVTAGEELAHPMFPYVRACDYLGGASPVIRVMKATPNARLSRTTRPASRCQNDDFVFIIPSYWLYPEFG